MAARQRFFTGLLCALQRGQVIEAVLESVTTDARGLRLSGRGIRPPRQRQDLQQTIEDVVSGQSTVKVGQASQAHH